VGDVLDDDSHPLALAGEWEDIQNLVLDDVPIWCLQMNLCPVSEDKRESNRLSPRHDSHFVGR